MRKVLSVVLALLMVASMGATAFASATVGGTGTGGSWFEVGGPAPGQADGYHGWLRVETRNRLYAVFPLPRAATILREDVPGEYGVLGRWVAGSPNPLLPRGVNPLVGDSFWHVIEVYPNEAQALSVLPDGWQIIPISDPRITYWYEERPLPPGTTHVFFVDMTDIVDETEFFRIRWDFEHVTLGDQRTHREIHGVRRQVWAGALVTPQNHPLQAGGTVTASCSGPCGWTNIVTRPDAPAVPNPGAALGFHLARSWTADLTGNTSGTTAPCTSPWGAGTCGGTRSPTTAGWNARPWDWNTMNFSSPGGYPNSPRPRFADPIDSAGNPLVYPPSRPNAAWMASYSGIPEREHNLNSIGPMVGFWFFEEDDLDNARPGNSLPEYHFVIPPEMTVASSYYAYPWTPAPVPATATYPMPPSWMDASSFGQTGHHAPTGWLPTVGAGDGNVHTITPTPWPTLYGRDNFNANTPIPYYANPYYNFVLEYEIPIYVPRLGVIPTNWRVRGWRTEGTNLLFGQAGQMHLNGLNPITGDSSNREMILTPEMFYWETRTGTGSWVNADPSTIATINMENPQAMRLHHLDRVSVVTNRTTGMQGTIRDVEFDWSATGDNAGVAIRVRTPVYMTRTGNTDVEFDVNLRIGGSNVLLGRVALVVGNDRYYVNDNDAQVSPSRTQYLRAESTVRNIEIYAGHGVTFTRNITGGQSIYVQASLWTDNAADVLFQNHPELVDIIDIHHSGMNVAGVTAHIEPNSVHFVYNAQRQLIGTTADANLPFSTRYYITTAQVNLGTAGGTGNGQDGQDTGDPDSPPAGGDGGAPNVNLNPGTGR